MKFSALLKPEYLLNPRQIPRRILRGLRPPRTGRQMTRLPWGGAIEVSGCDDIGKSIVDLGVYDLAISEVMWRLCDPGETALDIGANIGYVSALLAGRVGAGGRVLSFEAHPEIVQELRANVARWEGDPRLGRIEIFGMALSDRGGSVQLEVPPDFSHNRGLCRVAEGGDGGATLTVPCSTLGSVLGEADRIGVAKLDVEGHEEAVLRGAEGLLRGGRVRDWVFEHHPDYPSPVTALFEAAGYALFQIEKRFRRPALVPPPEPIVRPTWEAPNYLATLDPARATGRMGANGWNVLRASRA